MDFMWTGMRTQIGEGKFILRKIPHSGIVTHRHVLTQIDHGSYHSLVHSNR